MKLTQEQIEEIRKRAEAATIGDWDYDVEDFDISNGNFMVLQGEVRESDGTTYATINAKEADLRFICGAREDIPALLAHIAELQAENKALKSDACMWRNLRLEASARIAELQSQGIHGFSERDEFDELMEAMNDDEE